MVYMKVNYERTVRCILSCVNANGQGEFVPVKVVCNDDDYDLGNHYGAVKAWAKAHDYEDPYVVVDEIECRPATVLAAFDWDAVPWIDPAGKRFPF